MWSSSICKLCHLNIDRRNTYCSFNYIIKSSRVRTPKNKRIVCDIRKKLELPSLGVTSPIKENSETIEPVKEGGHWDFRFCGFGHVLDRFFGFCAKKTPVFRFWSSLRFADFPFLIAFGFRFSRKILTGFRFFLFDLFEFRFLFDLSGNYAPPQIWNSR